MIALRKPWRLPFMSSDSDIPDRFGPAIRWVIVVIALFVFFLLGAEEFKDGKPISGAIFSVLFILTFILAVKWHQIAEFLGGRKVTMLYVGLAILCAIGLGISLGKLTGRTEQSDMRANPSQATVVGPNDTGRIAWNFEEAAKGLAYFLGIHRQNQEEIRISGFAAHGRNTSNDPITELKGYVRSDVTNEEWTIYVTAEDPNRPNDPFAQHIPTLVAETFGIPGSAEFNITTFNKGTFDGSHDGVLLSKFLRDFRCFTLVLEYDGTVYKRQFTEQEIKGQFELFERQTDPSKNSAPRIVRRPNATPPIQPSFPFLLPPASSDRAGEAK